MKTVKRSSLQIQIVWIKTVNSNLPSNEFENLSSSKWFFYTFIFTKLIVPPAAVLMVTDIFSIESSTGILYRLTEDPSALLFVLRLMVDPSPTILSPSNVPIVKLATCSSSPTLLNIIARPEVLFARSLKAWWIFFGLPGTLYFNVVLQ